MTMKKLLLATALLTALAATPAMDGHVSVRVGVGFGGGYCGPRYSGWCGPRYYGGYYSYYRPYCPPVYYSPVVYSAPVVYTEPAVTYTPPPQPQQPSTQVIVNSPQTVIYNSGSTATTQPGGTTTVYTAPATPTYHYYPNW